MRIYCLASISQIPSPTDYIPPIPYDDGADELNLFSNTWYGEYIGFNDKNTIESLPSDYRLTEISIGWKSREGEVLFLWIAKNSEGKCVKLLRDLVFQDLTSDFLLNGIPQKLFVIEIFQSNSELINFEMLRGFATIPYIDKENGCFDLCLATSKVPTEASRTDFDLKIRAFYIKNTTTRGIITAEEEFAYISFAKQVNDFWKENPQITPENFRMEILQNFGPLDLPNPSTPKVLTQKLTDFQTAVDLLCNPKTGSYSNITPTVYNPKTKTSYPSRIYQQSECLLMLKQSTWHAKQTRAMLNSEKNKFRDCRILKWKNIKLHGSINFAAFNFQNLAHIIFEKVYLGESLEYWDKLATQINFCKMDTIWLQNCEIEELDDKFFENLSQSISVLNLKDNNITRISNRISKLTELHWMELSGNQNLSDDGIPWNELPSSIKILNLENTNISTVPSEIQKMTKLFQLSVSSPILNNVDYAASDHGLIKNPHMQQCRDFGLINLNGKNNRGLPEIIFKNIKTDEAVLTNLKYVKFDPSDLTALTLVNNKLQNFEITVLEIFNIADINYDRLTELTISKNRIKTFSWNFLPKTIQRLDLSHNELAAILSPTEEDIDFSIFEEFEKISFQGNVIQFLPKGFQKFPALQKLNLSFNEFGHYGFPLIENLWECLPKSIVKLNIAHNKIHSIPCCIRNFNIEDLNVSTCNLHYICPYLHTNVQKTAETDMRINVFGNPLLQHSFIPNIIYPLPPTDVHSMDYEENFEANASNWKNLTTTKFYAEEKPIRDTSRTKYNNKAVYEFKTNGVENCFACKCCAMCGESTDEPLFRQVMAMDCSLIIKKQEEKNEEMSLMYGPSEWRSKITSRMCLKCKEILKKKIDEAFVEFDKKVKTNVEKKKKPSEKDIATPACFEVEALNNTALAGSSTSNNVLPPINTLLYNHPQEIQYAYDFLNPAQTQAHNISWNPTMDNISSTNIPAPATNEIPPLSILLDEQGNQVAVWNSYCRADIPNTDIPSASMVQEPYPFQNTFSNQNSLTTPIPTENLFPDNVETFSSQTEETCNGHYLQEL